jgi:hypothetical protein
MVGDERVLAAAKVLASWEEDCRDGDVPCLPNKDLAECCFCMRRARQMLEAAEAAIRKAS